MTTIEVMRKALEALEQPNAGLVPHDGEWRSRRSITITALRAELERLEAVWPVAYMWQHDETGRVGFTDPWQRQNGFEANNPRCKLVAPLYTAPIARSIPAPTHEQIDEGWIQCGGSGSAYDAWHDGARWAYDLAAKRAGAQVKGVSE